MEGRKVDPITLKIVEIRDNPNNKLSFRNIGEKFGLSAKATHKRYARYKKRKKEQSSQSFEIIGVGPEIDLIPPEELWENAINAQIKVFEILKRRREEQRIILPAPGALAFLSDLHFGSPYTDYKTIKQDAEIIRDTPDMVAGFHGDGIDNWITPKLAKLQRDQSMTLDAEWQIFFNWLSILKNKLGFVIPGNHDNWTRSMAGIDRIRDYLYGTRVLYHPQQVKFDLIVGPATYTFKVRHKWRGHSVFNPTHGLEVGWERGDDDYDFAVGGHTHIGTFCRPFIKHGKKRAAILTGTYKVADEHGEEIGYPSPHGRGCGALVFNKNGEWIFCENLKTAAEYLSFLDKGKP